MKTWWPLLVIFLNILFLLDPLPAVAQVQSTISKSIETEKLFVQSKPMTVMVDEELNGLEIQLLMLEQLGRDDRGLRFSWELKMRGKDGLDSLVIFHIRFEADGIEPFEDFLIREPFAEVAVPFGRSGDSITERGELLLPGEVVASLGTVDTVEVTLAVDRATIDDLHGLRSAVPNMANGLLAQLRLAERESPPAAIPVVRPSPEPTSGTQESPPQKTGEEKRSEPGFAETILLDYFESDSRFIIATLPDPADSRFARELDLMLASIRKGIEDLGQGHTLHGHTLPWGDGQTPSGSSDLHRREPGVVLFGSETHPDIVLLIVGEVPGAGVHADAMAEAVRLARKARKPGEPGEISILGPTFSGSRASLWKAWKALDDQETDTANSSAARLGSALSPEDGGQSIDTPVDTPADTPETGARLETKFYMVSGSATSHTNQEEFRKQCPEQQPDCMEFEPIPRSDKETTCVLLGLLHDLGILRHEIILLTESSLYGSLIAETPPKCGTTKDDISPIRAPTFVVGRERLWQLRSETRWFSDSPQNLAGLNPGSIDWVSTPVLSVPFPTYITQIRVESNKRQAELGTKGDSKRKKWASLVTEANALGNSLPNHAPRLSARTKEILLGNLLRNLAAARPKAIWIVATDPRDKLFLADRLNRYVPNALLVTQEADHLLVHPDYQRSTTGMLVFSTILEAPVDEAGPSPLTDRQHARHANDWSLGAYRAIRRLVIRQATPVDEEPSGSPVADRSTREDEEPSGLQVADPSNREDETAIVAQGHRDSWGLLVLALTLGAAVLVLLYRARRLHQKLFVPGSRAARNYIFFPALVPGLALNLFVVFDLPRWATIARESLRIFTTVDLRLKASTILVWLGLLASLTVFAWFSWTYVIRPAYGYWRLPERPPITRSQWRYGVATCLMAAILTLPLVNLWLLYRIVRAGPNEAWAERYFAIDSGVSPLLPLALLLFVIIGWVGSGLWRMYFAGEADSSRPNNYRGLSIGAETLEPLSISNVQPKLGVLLAITLFLVYVQTYYQPLTEVEEAVGQGFDWNMLRSFEGCELGQVATVWFVLGLILAAMSGLRAFDQWQTLQQITDDYSRKRTVSGDPATDAWYQPFGDGVRSLLRLQEWQTFRRRWHHLREAFAVAKAQEESPEWAKVSEILDQDSRTISEGGDATVVKGAFVLPRVAHWTRTSAPPESHHVVEARRLFSEKLSRLCEFLDIRTLRPVGEEEPSASQRIFGSPENGSDSLGPLRRFLATELGFHVRCMAQRIRSLIVFTTTGLVVLLLALATYPFEPRDILLKFGTMVVVAGAIFTGWLLVQMEKDPMLSWLAGSGGGSIDWNRSFVGRLLFFEGLPILSVAAARFPAIPELLSEWIQPFVKLLTS